MKQESKNERPLISPTTLIKPFTSLLMKDIPSWILESSRQFGSDLMTDLEEEYLNLKEPNEFTKRIRAEIEKIGPIIGVEVFKKNNFYNGTIDIEGDNFFVEIKTRSNHIVRFSDRLQILIYNELLGFNKKPYLLTYNKKDDSIKVVEIIFSEEDRELKKSLEAIYKLLWKEKKLWKDGRYE